MKSLIDKYPGYALITGASSGIGQAYAYYLAQQKFPLILVARNEEKLKKIKTDLTNRFNNEVHVISADLSYPNPEKSILEYTMVNHLEISMLINNAGSGTVGEFGHESIEVYYSQMSLNCHAVVGLTHAYLPQMKKKKQGAVIIISSLSAYLPLPNYAVYAATKTFDLSFGKTLSLEATRFGIDVLTVCPGVIDTNFHKAARGRLKENFFVKTGKAEDVVNLSFAKLGKKKVIIPGFINQLTAFAGRFLPNLILYPMVTKLSKIQQFE